MEQPLVSIGMTFLNGGRFIAEAIESVRAQTYPAWELLLVDDGSTDSSSEIARRYVAQHGTRMRYLEHEGHVNRGISASRNLAVRHARGKYVGFLDADDLWLPHKLKEQVRILETHPDASMVYGVYECWYSWTGRPEDRRRDFKQDLGVQTGVVFPPSALLTLLYPLGQLATPSMSDFLVSRTLIEKVGGFEEQFGGMYEDHAFLVKAYLNAALIADAECWDKYRIHPDSCVSTETKRGHHRAARAEFFRWFEHYLRSQNIDDDEIWSAYTKALERKRTIEDHYAGWLFRVAPGNEAQLVTPPGSPDTLRVAITRCETSNRWDIQLNQPRFKTKAGQQYQATFKGRADRGRLMGVGVAMAHEPWSNLGMYRELALTPQWASFAIEFTATTDEDNARIHFDLGASDVSAELDAVNLCLPDGSPLPAVQFGDLRRVTPVSRNWGYDRGHPVDRYYIERFLARHAGDIRGHVLEIKDDAYTRQFGTDRVVRGDVLDVVLKNPCGTIFGDLVSLPQIPDETFDCVILTQTLQYVFDLRAAVATVHRILKRGGVVLATVPGITQTDFGDAADHLWSFTVSSARRLFEEAFSSHNVAVDAFGNILAVTSFLYGLPAEELTPQEIDHHDPGYEVTIAVRAVKAHPPQIETNRASAVMPANRSSGGKGLILMYHRVSAATADPFALSVAPELFAEQLDVVRRHGRPIALQELTQALQAGAIPPRSVVITIDDGYADNLRHARPLLDLYDIPATVFVATGYLDQTREFWWDELERILEPGPLPDTLELTVGGRELRWRVNGSTNYDLHECRRHARWRAETDAPPTPRHSLYSALWNLVHLMSEAERRDVLAEIATWCGRPIESRREYRTLTSEELVALARGTLIEIGAHTVNHPFLGHLPHQTQQTEIRQSKARLEHILGIPIGSFSFPHGSRSDETDAIVKQCGFDRACGSVRAVVEGNTDRFLLPRVQVENWDGNQFAAQLISWFEQ